MVHKMISRILVGCSLLGAALGATGCSSEANRESTPEATGALSLPLITQVGARSYRLTGYIQIQRADSWYYYQYLDLGEYADVASMDLTTGAYYAYLYSWQLSRDDGAGNYEPVSASLVSTNSQSFSIYNGSTTTISFEFQTDGQIVTVGSGKLNVDVVIDEAPGVCEPLGAGCPDGTWCAPSELLGADVQCVVAGAVEVGAPCGSPADCVANATCMDSGDGPRCTALCASADFGQPCASGGTCTPQGVDYGACTPDGEDTGAGGAPGVGGAPGESEG